MKEKETIKYGDGFGSTGYKLDTHFCHGGRDPSATCGVVNVPVVRASTVLYPNLDAYENSADTRLSYGRYGTQSNFALEDWLKDYEGADKVWLTPSGLDANIMVLQHLSVPGRKTFVSDNAYIPTKMVCEQILKPNGVEVIYFDPRDADALIAKLDQDTQMVFMESPGSSTFEMTDIEKIAKACRKKGILSAMDHVWSAGYFFRPLDAGVDVAVQSASKYLGGHADVIMGVVSVKAGKALDLLWERKKILVSSPSPDDAWLVLRGLRTLGVRLRQHQDAALEMASWLAKQEDVVKVLYPARQDCAGHDIWRSCYSGASSLMGVLLRGRSRAGLAALVDHMALFGMGASWGSYESLILPHDAARNFRSVLPFPEESTETTLVRLYIGLEHPDDLKKDLQEGFARRRKAMTA